MKSKEQKKQASDVTLFPVLCLKRPPVTRTMAKGIASHLQFFSLQTINCPLIDSKGG